jgi:(S)-mandelate dehydrogenase
MAKPVNVFDYRERSRKRLARVAFDYLDGGAEDEVTLRRNREIFARWVYNPRVLRGFGAVDLSRRILGHLYRLPLVIGPAGFCCLFWPQGDLALARAAGAAGIPYVLSTLATTTIEEVAGLTDLERWFQLYAFRDDARTDEILARARAAGYAVLVLTVDSAVSGRREATLRHGGLPMPKSLSFFWDVVSHPYWTCQILGYGPPRLRNLEPLGRPRRHGLPPPFSFDAHFKRTLSWDDVARIRALWAGRFVLKGLQSVEDARLAAQAGVDGIVLSNHGGRQLDGSPSAMEVLPEVVAAVGNDKMAIMVDGGFRRGGDVLKALALGADAVWLGRAPLYGLAADGQRGVSGVLEIFRQEMETTMVLLGVERLDQVLPQCLREHGKAKW